MKKVLLILLLFTALLSYSQPMGYQGVRLNGVNMTNQTFVYQSPGISASNSRLLLEFKDSTYYRILYRALRIDYLGSSSDAYLKTDLFGNIEKAPITDIFNSVNYYTKTQADALYLQSYIETDPIFVGDSSLFARKTYSYSKMQSDNRYLQGFTETDPLFLLSPSYNITPQLISNWNNSYTWGNHTLAGYIVASGNTSQYFRGDGSIATFPTVSPQVNITGGRNTKVTGTYPNIQVEDSTSTRFYNSSGRINQNMKMWVGEVTPSTTNGYSIDISSAGFTNIISSTVIAKKLSSSPTLSPQVSIKSETTTAITVNVIEDNPATISILGINVLSGAPSVFANTTGLTLKVIVIGY